jgi:hypothetical protein
LQLDPTLATQLLPHDTFEKNPPNAHPHKKHKVSITIVNLIDLSRNILKDRYPISYM